MLLHVSCGMLELLINTFVCAVYFHYSAVWPDHTHIYTIQFTAYRILNNRRVHTGRLDGPGIEPRWGRYFPHPWDPASLLYNGYPVLPGGKSAEAWRLQLTPSSAEVTDRVELHIYSPSGLSWPFLGWTSPLSLQTSRSQYEGWNFNSGNYLFKTDTK